MSSAASDVYKRQVYDLHLNEAGPRVAPSDEFGQLSDVQ